jgi:hypothetical protein
VGPDFVGTDFMGPSFIGLDAKILRPYKQILRPYKQYFPKKIRPKLN